jgi:hypothetical protein
MKQSNNEFDKFDQTMKALMSVPHEEIKAALEAEKAAKKKRKIKKKSSASGRADADKD